MDELREQVRQVLFANGSDGYSRLLDSAYCYVQPSQETYPFQFWWDTCFHVIILCQLGEYEWARRNLRSLFAMQEDNGFVGHMVFWKKTLPTHLADVLQARPDLRAVRPHMSALIQPPLAAQALERIYRGCGDADFVAELLPQVIRQAEWLHREREFDATGLLTTISPFESGIDFKPSYDPLLGYCEGKAKKKLLWKAIAVDAANFLRRYDLKRIREARKFLVQDVLVNTFYALDLLALSRLCEAQGQHGPAATYRARAEKVSAAVLERMYDPKLEAFLDLDSGGGRIEVLTFTIFVPLMLPGIPRDLADRLVSRHLRNPAEFALPYPVPSVAADAAAFNPREDGRYLWRGPTWAVANWCLWQGLTACGLHADAERIARSTRGLIAKSGFREYYDPSTGEGHGARNFTWPGLVLDMQPDSVPALDFGSRS